MDRPIRPNPALDGLNPDAVSAPSGGDTYATMKNRNIIVPPDASGHFSVEQHFFYDIMEKFLSEIQIDEDWYLAKYPDVQEAIETGRVKSGRHHYARFGFYEHRLPYAIEVTEKWYMDAYPDIKEAIQKGIYKSGQSHFELNGFREGRMPFPNFLLLTQ